MKYIIVLLLCFSQVYTYSKAGNTIHVSSLMQHDYLDIGNMYANKECIAIQDKNDSICSTSWKFKNDTHTNFRFFLRTEANSELSGDSRNYLEQIVQVKGKYKFYLFEIQTDSIAEITVDLHKSSLQTASVFYYSIVQNFEIRVFENKDIETINRLVLYAIIIVLLFLSILNFGGYYITKRRDYGYYGLYTSVLFLYFFFRFYIYDSIDISATQPIITRQHFNISIQPVFYIFYCKFVEHFLSTKNQYTNIHAFLKKFIIISSISTLAIFIMYYSSTFIAFSIFNMYRTIGIILSIYMIYLMLQHKSKLSTYIILGSLFLIIGGTIAMIFSFIDYHPAGIYPINFFAAGILFEILFFTLGMAQKTALDTEEKFHAQLALNKTLIEKEELQKNMNEQLNIQLDFVRKKLEEEKTHQLETLIALKDKEAEFELLLSQMNPHFLFNTMSSLKMLVVKEDKDEAIRHIDQLSKLVRNFLEFTRLKFVSIHEVTENLKIYVNLESARLNHPITFDVVISDEIDARFEEIPALILQPFIENALIHGLSDPSILKPHLTVICNADKDFLYISITDNGIGRHAAGNKYDYKSHNGFAIQNTAERIRILNEGRDGLYIEDLTNDDGSPAGTRVKLKIKRSTHEMQTIPS